MKVYPIVEGYGEVEAAPVLLRRLLAQADCHHIGIGRPIRRTQAQMRSKEGIQAAVQLARLQPSPAPVKCAGFFRSPTACTMAIPNFTNGNGFMRECPDRTKTTAPKAAALTRVQSNALAT